MHDLTVIEGYLLYPLVCRRGSHTQFTSAQEEDGHGQEG